MAKQAKLGSKSSKVTKQTAAKQQLKSPKVVADTRG